MEIRRIRYMGRYTFKRDLTDPYQVQKFAPPALFRMVGGGGGRRNLHFTLLSTIPKNSKQLKKKKNTDCRRTRKQDRDPRNHTVWGVIKGGDMR